MTARDFAIHSAAVEQCAAMLERLAATYDGYAAEEAASLDKDERRRAVHSRAQAENYRSAAALMRDPTVLDAGAAIRAADRAARAREIMLEPFSLGAQIAAGGVKR
jgi:hypothetical protein